MPITVSHQLSMTTPDNPAYENRPSHWNQSHAFTANMTGSEISGAFSNANGFSFGLNGGGAVTGSYTVPSTAGLISAVNVSAGTTSNNATAFTFADAGGVSFGMNGSVITASAPAAGGGLTNIRVSAGTTSNLLSAMTFSNSNGITFGLDAGTLTASHNALTSQSNQRITAANGGFDFQTLSFSNLNGISFGTSAGSAITASHNAITTGRASNDGIGLNTAQSNVTWTVNSSGLSLDARGYAGTGTSATNASITLNSNGLAISVAAPGGGGNFSAGVSNVGNTGGDTGVTGTRLVFVGSQNITLNQATDANGATISISGGAGAAGNTGFISAGGATASLGTVVYSNSNGVSFGVNGQTVTASHNGITQQSTQPVAVSGANGSYAFSTLSFSNANGISFGTSAGSAVTASHNALTSQSNQAASAANGSFAFQTVSFSNGNGVSFVTAAGSAIQASVETSYAASNHSHGNPTLALTNLSGTTASASNGFTLSLSAAAPGGGAAFSAGMSTQGNTAGTTGLVSNQIILVGSNGVSMSQSVNGGSATLSVIGPPLTSLSVTGALSASSNGSTISLGVGTVTASATSNTTQGSSGTINLNGLIFAGAGGASVGISNGSVVISGATGGGVSPVASASNGSFSFTTLAFSNANNVTFGTSAGSIITASVAPPGAAAENNAINLLGANTAGNTTVTGSTLGFSGLNLTLSGTNNSQMVISAPATSSLSATGIFSISTNGSTISMGVAAGTATMWQPFNEAQNVAGQQGNAIMHFAPLPTPAPAALGELQVDRLCLPLIISNSSNSTGTVTISHSFGLYTKNVSTLSLVMSTSYTAAATFSGTVNNSTYAGLRLHTLPWTTTIGDGRYYVAQWSRTTTGGGNCTVNQWLVSQANSNYSGLFGANSNRSQQYPLGMGQYSVSFSTAMPASVAISAIDGTASIVLRPPSFFMINGTV